VLFRKIYTKLCWPNDTYIPNNVDVFASEVNSLNQPSGEQGRYSTTAECKWHFIWIIIDNNFITVHYSLFAITWLFIQMTGNQTTCGRFFTYQNGCSKKNWT
jgi:hypothetical protein